VDELAAVQAIDLMGNGTACLVWSSPLPGQGHQPMRYIDLMGGQKPHLMTSVVNNLGAETKLQYAASTQFYLQDRRRKETPGLRGCRFRCMWWSGWRPSTT
jgi:hypothetical protein